MNIQYSVSATRSVIHITDRGRSSLRPSASAPKGVLVSPTKSTALSRKLIANQTIQFSQCDSTSGGYSLVVLIFGVS